MTNPLKEAAAEALFLLDQGEPWGEATSTSRSHYLNLADAAIRAMDRTEAWELLRTMANLLDGYMPILEDAAAHEANMESRKAMQKTTQRHRLKAADKAVKRAFDMLGLEP